MKKTNTYIAPHIKVRSIDMEDGLLAATTRPFSENLTIKDYRDEGNWITKSEQIGAKDDHTSGVWDEEE